MRRIAILVCCSLVIGCAQEHSIDWSKQNALFFEQLVLGPSPNGDAPGRIELRGHSTLVLGDSLVKPWPGDAVDVVSLPGKPTDVLAYGLRKYLDNHTRLILWPGTAHFMDSRTVEEYISDVRGMCAYARERGVEVVLLSPMYVSPQGADIYRGWAALADLPVNRISVIDLRTWQPELFQDQVHLTPEGTARVAQLVDRVVADAMRRDDLRANAARPAPAAGPRPPEPPAPADAPRAGSVTFSPAFSKRKWALSSIPPGPA